MRPKKTRKHNGVLDAAVSVASDTGEHHMVQYAINVAKKYNSSLKCMVCRKSLDPPFSDNNFAIRQSCKILPANF